MLMDPAVIERLEMGDSHAPKGRSFKVVASVDDDMPKDDDEDVEIVLLRFESEVGDTVAEICVNAKECATGAETINSSGRRNVV